PPPSAPGCKIKALRAKTNTYIKTPVRGEEPLFVVTGRKEDVAMARREIISAAEHFSMIRASRNKNTVLNGSVPSPPNLPGQTTIQVRVPYRVVGLVVGPKGATIKRIQQQTHTYIVTPSRDKEPPVFEVTGMPENVDRAREEIEAHIAMRTGGLIELIDENDFHANGTDVGFELGGGGAGSLWSKPTPSITPTPARKPFCSYRNDSSSSLGSASTDSYFGSSGRLADYSPPSPAALGFPPNGGPSNGYGVYGTPAEALASPDGCPAELPPFDSPPGFDLAPAPPAQLLWSQYERSTSLASPAIAAAAAAFPGSATTAAAPALFVSGGQRRGVPQAQPPTRVSPPLHSGAGGGSLAASEQHPLARRVRSDPGGRFLAYPLYANGLGCHLPGLPSNCSPSSSSSSSSSASSSSSSSSCSSSGLRRKGSRDCSVCFESEVIAALVPCGHNLFCMECANRICEKNEPQCPVCHSAVTQAIRIFS
ncbi:PREDICTED: RNA-binding protein MEX3B, partial [Thamnophis sirtalis]|uniref:RNA-binding protein MEX3B n=1 Tax=Thamnophis sirtalis TaxID=35019 RepID=A0A6I9Z4S5_9SAUR